MKFAPSALVIAIFFLTIGAPATVASFAINRQQQYASPADSSERVGFLARSGTPTTALGATSSRKDFLAATVSAAAVSLTAAAAGWPLAAHADITNKLASSQALRSVKIAQKKLSSASTAEYITTADYATLKSVLRVEPISGIRKASTILVRAGEDGPEADNLSSSYKVFIAKLEKMDSVASVAMRGRTVADSEFKESYEGAVSALNDFVAIAERSIETPVQYSD